MCLSNEIEGCVMADHTSNPLPMLERRRIEATILKTRLRDAQVEPWRGSCEESTRRSQFLDRAGPGVCSEGRWQDFDESLCRSPRLWQSGNALEVEVKEQTETSYIFEVTRCRYAEMYRDMGLGEIGHLLSCQRDGTFCEGYDKRLKLTRTQTIMQGASHCDFNYKLVDEPASR